MHTKTMRAQVSWRCSAVPLFSYVDQTSWWTCYMGWAMSVHNPLTWSHSKPVSTCCTHSLIKTRSQFRRQFSHCHCAKVYHWRLASNCQLNRYPAEGCHTNDDDRPAPDVQWKLMNDLCDLPQCFCSKEYARIDWTHRHTKVMGQQGGPQ